MLILLYLYLQSPTSAGTRGENSTEEADLGTVPPQHRACGGGPGPSKHFPGSLLGPRPHGGLGFVVRLFNHCHNRLRVFRTSKYSSGARKAVRNFTAEE